jgi:hypothetical protein
VRHIGNRLWIVAMGPTGIMNEPRRCRLRKAIFTDSLVARSEEYLKLRCGRGSIDEPKVDIRVGHPTMV